MTTAPQLAGMELIALDDAFTRATPRLKRYAARRLLDDHEAEEVVQEALLRAYQHRATFATEDDLNAWLTVVTARLVIDRCRVRGRSVPVAELPPQARVARDTAEVVVARDEARAALDALESMPARQAAVLWAREVEGLSYDDLCDRFQLSEPTVRSLLHRARRTLRREYAARGGTLPVAGLVVLAPWLDGMQTLGKLRALARKAGAGATITAAGLATAAAVLSTPADRPAQPHALVPPPSSVVTLAEPAPVEPPTASRAEEPASRVAAPAVALPVAEPPAPPQRRPVPFVPQACGSALGVNCGTHDAPGFFLGPALPENPTTYRRVGVSHELVDCTLLPTTLLTTCTPGDGTTAPAHATLGDAS